MRIFFENKFFEFVEKPLTGASGADLGLGANWAVWEIDDQTVPSPEALLEAVGCGDRLAVVCRGATDRLEQFCNQMVIVRAAGGVVENTPGDILIMTRKGWYDLPKGHIDPGETAEEAAIREVMEETGLAEVEIVAPLCTTRHFHNAYGRWEVKQTEWFVMLAPGEAPEITPQQDENITAVEWLRGRRLWKAVDSSYSTIKTLFEHYLDWKIR